MPKTAPAKDNDMVKAVAAGVPGTGEDICPECKGTGQQVTKETGKRADKPCERCDGTGIIIEGIG